MRDMRNYRQGTRKGQTGGVAGTWRTSQNKLKKTRGRTKTIYRPTNDKMRNR